MKHKDDPKLEFHPIAEMFPLMEGEEFDALVADIKANGLCEPIVLHEGKVLDGRNRYQACRKAGVKPKFKVSELIHPASYVISANICRRHLTAEQKREVLAKLVAMQPEKSDRQLAKEAGVDHKIIAKARRTAEATGEASPVAKRTGADGKARNLPKKKKVPRVRVDQRKAHVHALITELGDSDADSRAAVVAELLSGSRQDEFKAVTEAVSDLYQKLQAGRVEDHQDADDDDDPIHQERRGRNLGEAISDAFGMMQELCDECREVVDNTPENLRATQRIETLDETASALENLSAPDVSAELAKIKIRLPIGRKPRSRHDRMDDAVTIINKCIEALDDIVDENDPRHKEARSLRDVLDNNLSEVEMCEFPGMYR
jgi:ParB-like chromosome segregation protein Spo0J